MKSINDFSFNDEFMEEYRKTQKHINMFYKISLEELIQKQYNLLDKKGLTKGLDNKEKFLLTYGIIFGLVYQQKYFESKGK